MDFLTDRLRSGGILIDVKSVLDDSQIRSDVQYWGFDIKLQAMRVCVDS